MTYDLDINQEHENLKNDYERLMKQKNDLVEENQDIKNSLSELQTKINLEMSQMLVKMMPTWQTMIIPNNIPNEQFMVKLKEIQKKLNFIYKAINPL
jgi:recombinational DNA repair ATPase RecF